MNPTQKLIEAAEAVCDRWDSPLWKDAKPTADYIATLREAVRGLREAGEPAAWRPIETAPKDGTHILLSDGERVSVGAWASDMDYGADYEGQIGMATWWAVDLGPNNDRPTLWMPLPAAPGAAPPSPAPQHSAIIEDLRSEIVALHATEENLRAGLV